MPISNLTWKEFKGAVEGAGVTDDMEIAYIDMDGYTSNEPDDLVIEIDRHDDPPSFSVH